MLSDSRGRRRVHGGVGWGGSCGGGRWGGGGEGKEGGCDGDCFAWGVVLACVGCVAFCFLSCPWHPDFVVPRELCGHWVTLLRLTSRAGYVCRRLRLPIVCLGPCAVVLRGGVCGVDGAAAMERRGGVSGYTTWEPAGGMCGSRVYCFVEGRQDLGRLMQGWWGRGGREPGGGQSPNWAESGVISPWFIRQAPGLQRHAPPHGAAAQVRPPAPPRPAPPGGAWPGRGHYAEV